MAEAKKQTYSMYGKDYDFEDLQRRADAGLNQYISTLKRGYKDQDKFRKAYRDLMSGIQDGTITFQNGQYVDSGGRYSNGNYTDYNGKQYNSNNKKKDYYGLMANYIYNQQMKGKPYTLPEDDSKIKWGANALANQIKIGLLGNSNNAQDFLDQDEVVNNVRGTSNRIKALQSVFTDLRDNFDTKFTGYNDRQKEEALQYLNGAITALSDNSADSARHSGCPDSSRQVEARTYRRGGDDNCRLRHLYWRKHQVRAGVHDGSSHQANSILRRRRIRPLSPSPFRLLYRRGGRRVC